MDKKYSCYCGLYCGNCAVKVKVESAAKVLYGEMKAAGFEDVIAFIPGGDGFWAFLKGMANDGMCVSCRDGGGDPGCVIRISAKEKGVEMCSFCNEYPCEKLSSMLKRHSLLGHDNALLRDIGWEAWAELQDGRRARGFSHTEAIIESRCGILCAECPDRAQMKCDKCININKPFWGDSCPVKDCCESKNLDHCGLCGDFPCDLLNQFAYDKEHGDNGARVEQCKKWASLI
jgi:hypothetical protein